MKKNLDLPRFSLTLLLLCLLVFQSKNTEAQLSYCQKVEKLLDLLDEYHIQPAVDNEENSKIVFNEILDNLDANGYYFISSEIDSLRNFESELFDFPYSRSCEFYTLLEKSYSKSLKRNDSILNVLKKYSFKLNDPEIFYISSENPYCNSGKKLFNKWRKRIEMRNAMLTSNQIDPDSTWKGDLNPKENIQKAIEYYQCKISNYLGSNKKISKRVGNIYLNAYCFAYDPHSTYFNTNQHDNFINDLSSESLSYGMELRNNKDGDVVINQIIPGSPAWKSNQIHKGDKIISVKLENGKELTSNCASAYSLQKALVFTTETLIKVKLKKAKGSIKVVELLNETLENEENIIKSYILSGEHKLGYIGLPGFYTEWDGKNQLGSANDIGKEIIKLKKDNIEGLIFDLRYNGGGSVQEALQIAGTFIGEGSLAIEKERDIKPHLLKDPHRGRVYTGPLIVLINELSASASEITAGILQDHNRAIIVGSTSYGKGTGQIILPLDIKVSSDGTSYAVKDSTAGYVKFTVGKYYNLKGKTHQGKGITPDIELPDFYKDFTNFESDYLTYIKPDSIEKKTYYTPYPAFPLEELEVKSKLRISREKRFAEIEKSYQNIEKNFDQYDSLNLSFNAMMKLFLESDKLLMEYDNLKELEHDDFSISTPKYDQLIYQFSEQKQKIRDKTSSEIQKDILLREAYYIMIDLINKNNN